MVGAVSVASLAASTMVAVSRAAFLLDGCELGGGGYFLEAVTAVIFPGALCFLLMASTLGSGGLDNGGSLSEASAATGAFPFSSIFLQIAPEFFFLNFPALYNCFECLG